MLRKLFPNRENTVRREDDCGSSSGSFQAFVRRGSSRHVNSMPLTLADLRIDNEADHSLINIPMVQSSYVDRLTPPVDQMSAAFQGRAFLQFLSTDRRLGAFFKAFIDGNRVLSDPGLTEAKAISLAEQLRPIVAQAYQDPELIRKMESCALETTGYCSGRAQIFVGQMRDAALLSFVRTGQMDDVALYNLGISFFMLDAVRTEVGRRSPPGGHAQNVHDYLDAEFYLQDELNLPTKHTRPEHVNVGFISAAVAREIGNAVKAKAYQNNGEKVRDFLSTWAPWQEYIAALPKNRADFELVSQNYEKALEQLQADRETPGTPAAALSEADYLLDIEAIAERRTDWIVQTIGQKTFEFWATHKAECLLDAGKMPKYFNRFKQ